MVTIQPLTIEVLGIGFPNKGAELMLLAISEWAARLPVETRLAVRWDTRFEDRLRHKLWAKVWHPVSARLPYGHLANRWPEGVARRLGVVRERDVDVFMDASGYAYGDSWGAAKARDRLGSRIGQWRRQGSRVVLLPQAFGPFETPALRAEMQSILSQADRIYARDEASLANLRQLAPGSRSVARGYDFTCLVSPQPFRGMDALEGVIGVIPNHKMYSQGAGLTRAGYLDYLIGVAQGVLARGHRVALILHEGDQDRRLCEEIQRAVEGAVEIVSLLDPREIKMAIGKCSCLLTSRFHGFASGLFQGVPTLATSWSHKYQELARDFGAPDLVLDELSPEQTVERLEGLCSRSSSEKLRRQLGARSEDIKNVVRGMWTEIESITKSARTPGMAPSQ
jgi:colanic acid/amylovoran biosynthesis protein